MPLGVLDGGGVGVGLLAVEGVLLGAPELGGALLGASEVGGCEEVRPSIIRCAMNLDGCCAWP